MAEEMLANYWWSMISPCTVAPPSNGDYILKMPDLDEEGNERMKREMSRGRCKANALGAQAPTRK
jgi:hypothetical protein